MIINYENTIIVENFKLLKIVIIFQSFLLDVCELSTRINFQRFFLGNE